MFYSLRKTSGFYYLEIIYSYFIHFCWLKPKLFTMVYKAMHNLTPTYLSTFTSYASPPCSLHLQSHWSFIFSNTLSSSPLIVLCMLLPLSRLLFHLLVKRLTPSWPLSLSSMSPPQRMTHIIMSLYYFISTLFDFFITTSTIFYYFSDVFACLPPLGRKLHDISNRIYYYILGTRELYGT